jgi:hypothetical protein
VETGDGARFPDGAKNDGDGCHDLRYAHWRDTGEGQTDRGFVQDENDRLAEPLKAIDLPDRLTGDEGRDAVEPAGLAGQWFASDKHAVGQCDRSFRLSFDGGGCGKLTRSKRGLEGKETRRRRGDQARIFPVQPGGKCAIFTGTQLPTVRLGRWFEERDQRPKSLGNHSFVRMPTGKLRPEGEYRAVFRNKRDGFMRVGEWQATDTSNTPRRQQ